MKKRRFVPIIIIILILSTSCIKKTNKKPMKIGQKEKAPASLVSVVEGIDHVLDKVEEIQEVQRLTEEELKVEEENKKETNKKDKDKEPLIKDKLLFKEWNDVDKKVEEIHKGWNSYEVESIKKGANLEKGKDLKKNLNLFTIAAENREIKEIIDKGSRAMFSLAFFFDLYKDEINGDLSRIKYAVYQTYLNAEGGNIIESNNLLDSTEEYITRLKQKVDKDKTKIKNLDKLSLAIADMKLCLKENSIKLLKIKKDIILKNIKSLEK